MSRPTIEESISESDWSFFMAEWQRYVEATELKEDDEAAVRHLWQACSDSLRRALHNDGARSIKDVNVLLNRVKSLCVQRRNNLVNILTLQKMGQERDEGVLAFVARLNGQVNLCDLNVVCSCQKVVSFADRFKTLQLIHGIYDKEIQEKVLAAGAALSEGQEMSLADVIKMVQSCEMGKYTHAEISKAGGINRISEHRRNKDQGRQSKGKEQGDAKCGFCGRSRHSREECPAREAKCNNCGNVGHFAAKCRKAKKDKGKVAAVAEKDKEPDKAAVQTVQTVEDGDNFFGEPVAQVNRVSVSEAELPPRSPLGFKETEVEAKWCTPLVSPIRRVWEGKTCQSRGILHPV